MMSISGPAYATLLYRRAISTIKDKESACTRIELLSEARRIYNLELCDNEPMYLHYQQRLPMSQLLLRKNIGIASIRLAEALLEAEMPDTERIYNLARVCIRYLSLNWLWRPQERELEWGRKVTRAIYDAIELVFKCAQEEESGSKEDYWPWILRQLDVVGNEIAPDFSLVKFRLRFHTQRTRFYILMMEEIMGQNNLALTSRVMGNCWSDCVIVRRYILLLGISPASAASLKQIEETENVLRSLPDSTKFRKAADDLLRKGLQSEPGNVDFKLTWEILEMYKAAAICAATKAIQTGTIATARRELVKLLRKSIQGKVHLKMFTSQAKSWSQGLDAPEDLELWFWDCVRLVGDVQRESTGEEGGPKGKTSAKNRGKPVAKRMRMESQQTACGQVQVEERPGYLKQLKHDLRDLKMVADCPMKLLQHLYEKHPPRTDPKFKYGKNQMKNLPNRKVLLKAIYHYHPDKQSGQDKKWQILCLEIIKCLNSKFELMK